MMDLTINGTVRQVSADTVLGVVAELGLQDKLIVVELEGRIIEKEQWDRESVRQGMKMEIVHFVGGG
ncbi:sulfur carrier protein ThiS [Paenibacillus senegalensis]|uniref:sulfur carrier protein ThiS n=1 Tax=Paenibacillus senegalensis TaxID=1465766 RepID=UPI000287FBAF|nr:sulfur carrier protein ThiS [Paenibacillus senegalensis]